MKTKDDILLEGFTRYKIDLTEEQLEELMYDLGALRVKRQGNNLQFDHCILHHNNSPTLGISLEDGKWNCFSCDGCQAGLSAMSSYISPRPEFTPPVIYSRETRDRMVFLVEAVPSARLNPGQPVDVQPLEPAK